MIILCCDMTNFLDTVKGLVERGLTFKADAGELTITLTGGY